LKAIITISANATTQDQSVIGPNELTRQLVSEECIRTLITDMLRGGNPLTVGVGIVIEVIRKNNSDYDLENQIGPVPKSSDPIYLGTLLRQFAKHIPDFMELVHNPNHTIVNSDGTTTTRRRELKAAFGEKIEPLGFDRFKTCELMAELLHCSNMALLNERGSEAEVKRRDVERERLKAEGKLTPKENLNMNDFGTSVDSHGFHHARAPSSESPEEIKRLEVQNNSEEDLEFEKVAASEAIQEESKDNFDDKEEIGEPLMRSPKTQAQIHALDKPGNHDGEFVDEPLSPARGIASSAKEESKSTAKVAEAAESPTSAGLTAKVDQLDLDNDTVMRSSSPTEEHTKEGISSKPQESLLTKQLHKPSETEALGPPEGLSPHADDKPPPLFANRRENSKPTEQPRLDPAHFTAGVPESEGSEVTPIDDASSSRSVLLSGPEGQYTAHYEVDIDGSPVVGDLLKMRFVENKVVPTILVSNHRRHHKKHADQSARISSSGSHGTTSFITLFTMWYSRSSTARWTAVSIETWRLIFSRPAALRSGSLRANRRATKPNPRQTCGLGTWAT
jgi:SIT4-associating protein SAP185/190